MTLCSRSRRALCFGRVAVKLTDSDLAPRAPLGSLLPVHPQEKQSFRLSPAQWQLYAQAPAKRQPSTVSPASVLARTLPVRLTVCTFRSHTAPLHFGSPSIQPRRDGATSHPRPSLSRRRRPRSRRRPRRRRRPRGARRRPRPRRSSSRPSKSRWPREPTGRSMARRVRTGDEACASLQIGEGGLVRSRV